MQLTIHMSVNGAYKLGPGYSEREVTVDKETYDEISHLYGMSERLSDLLETLYKEAS